MERLKKQNENYYNIYALGRWWSLEWLVFENQPEQIQLPEEAELVAYWLDWWYSNDPTALVGLYKWNNWYVIDELIYQTKLTNDDIINKLKVLGVKKEDQIFADSAEPKSIEEIYRAWYNIQPTKKGKDSVMFWIDIMKQEKLYITKSSHNTISEFVKYVWQTDKNWKPLNKPVDFNNHSIDAIRYIFLKIKDIKNYDIIFW